mmetsp:Transcript_115893/g.247656  ORF Transcript_115893/g.247656 Transcript_115893/m.247656 type:complete len:196 (+) Transcript_115893:53-640(+)
MTGLFHFKVVIIGNANVGKSCLAVRFCRGEFKENQEPSIGACFMTQTVKINDSEIKFEMWDTAGQERYKALAPMYYRGAAVGVIVFDITSKDSFAAAKLLVQELRGTDALIALAGNKSDLVAQRKVTKQEAQEYANEENIVYMETSAKTGENVNEFFGEIAVRLPKIAKKPNEKKGFKVAGANRSDEAEAAGGCC